MFLFEPWYPGCSAGPSALDVEVSALPVGKVHVSSKAIKVVVAVAIGVTLGT